MSDLTPNNLSFEYIKNQTKVLNLKIGKLFSKALLESAKNGDLRLFKIYDLLDDENEVNMHLLYSDCDFNKGHITIEGVYKELLKTSIKNYDETILDYLLNENKYLKNRKYIMCFIFKDFIELCIYLNMFDFAKKLIDASNSKEYNYQYVEFMEKLIGEDSIPRLEFMLDNFNFSDEYKFSFLIMALKAEKINSLQYLKSQVRESAFNNTVDKFNVITTDLVNKEPKILNKEESIKECEELNCKNVGLIRNLLNKL